MKMNAILRTIAGGLTALGTPWFRKPFARESSTPFADDRKRLLEDRRKVMRDLRQNIAKVKEQSVSETYRR